VKPAPVIKEEPVPEEPPASLEPPAPVEEQDEPIDSFSDCYLSDEEPDQEDTPPAEESITEADDDYDVLDDLLSDSAHEEQPESPVSPVSVTKPDPEPVVEPIPEEPSIPKPDTEPEVDQDPEPKQGTKAHWAWYERHRWDRKLWVKNSKDHTFDELYNTGKDLWAKYQDESDEYDWDILAFEVEECPTYVKDEYHLQT
ncbi:hypothetical protein RhiirA4_491634, partial [Rhizophagus irregularis]